MSKSWTEEFLRRIDSSFKDFPPSLYGRILTEQINIFSHLMRIISTTGLMTAAFLLSAFWPFSGKELILTTALGLAVTYVAIIRATFAWSREPEQTTRARQFMRASNRLVFALGTLWAVLVVQLTMIATADQRSLVYGVTIGLVSTAVLVVPLSAAAAFWIPTTIGAFTALWVTGRPIDIMTGMCLFGYSVLILFSGLYLNRKLCERALNEMELQEQGEVIGMLLRDFEESSSDWLWETDERLLLNHVSSRFSEAMRMPKEALLGRSLQSMIGYARPLRGPARDPVSRIIRCVSNRAAFSDVVLPVRIDREEHWWSLTGKPMFDNRGRFVGYRGVGSDVTAIKLSEGQIARLASYDSLTDLPNRTVLANRLQQACSRCQEHNFALLYLDLDEFKAVNDSSGHAVGDALLIAVARRLRDCVRDVDLVARFGGDEFAILLADAAEASAVARRLIECVRQPYTFDGLTVEVGLSVGFTLAPADGDTPSQLMKNADLALYCAKAEGRGTWCAFQLEMAQKVSHQQMLRTDLRDSLARGELAVQFQPIVDLTTSQIDCGEALLRWHHPTVGLLLPTDFIPVAEASGVIVPIGEWTSRVACEAATRWPASMRISVNLSPIQVRDEGFIAMIDDVLSTTGLAANRLELELTETTFLEANRTTLACLTELRDRGIRIALDDFGTGYSSLQYLADFSFDTIKIDRSFVNKLGRDKSALAILEAITTMAKSLGMVTVAEGLETEEQLRLLKRVGCTLGQGFLFGRPRSAQDFELPARSPSVGRRQALVSPMA